MSDTARDKAWAEWVVRRVPDPQMRLGMGASEIAFKAGWDQALVVAEREVERVNDLWIDAELAVTRIAKERDEAREKLAALVAGVRELAAAFKADESKQQYVDDAGDKLRAVLNSKGDAASGEDV